MGCMASKLENEDAVTRCKDRRRHMKEAIYAHRHLVTAHSNYVCSLPVIGSALSDFAGDAVKEYFDKAASAGEKVSEMLETGRAQLDRSRSQLTGTLSHSSGVSSNLSSQPSLIDEQGGTKSLCSTLEWLLAWEEELKARDGMKIGKEKNMERLQVSSGMEKRIFRCIINGTWSALVPQLAELCHRSMNMWKSLNEFAEVQNHVPQLRGQVNRSANGKSTSNLDPKSIDRLQSALSNWHGSFCRRTKFEREFIHSLHAWFQLLPPNAELPHPTTVLSDVVGLFDKWMIFHDSQLAKDAPRAIKNFNSLVQNISRTQTEQLKKPKKIDKKSKLAACQREVKEEMLRRTEEEEKTRMNDILMGSLTVLQTLSNNFYGSIVQALETVCKQYDNARGVPEESGSDVEAHGGGGGGGGGGESYNNNAEGVPEESGIGDAEAHGGGGGGGGESDNSNSEGSQRRVEEEMLRHMKEETATLTNMMALLERIAEEVVLRQRSRLRRRH